MKIIIGNFKAYLKNSKEALELFELYKTLSKSKKSIFILAPSHIHLPLLKASYKGKLISFCAQSLRSCDSGACTGELIPEQVNDLGVKFALVGHSEQRSGGLSDEEIAKQIKKMNKIGMVPVLIIGESARHRKESAHFRFVKKQIKSALSLYPTNKPLKLMVAYEPVWAVGASRPPKLQDIEMMMIYIRKTLVEMFGERRGKSVPLLYGGSVNKDNASIIFSIRELSGVLLGRASVSKDEVKEIYLKSFS